MTKALELEITRFFFFAFIFFFLVKPLSVVRNIKAFLWCSDQQHTRCEPVKLALSGQGGFQMFCYTRNMDLVVKLIPELLTLALKSCITDDELNRRLKD